MSKKKGSFNIDDLANEKNQSMLIKFLSKNKSIVIFVVGILLLFLSTIILTFSMYFNITVLELFRVVGIWFVLPLTVITMLKRMHNFKLNKKSKN